MQSWIFKRNEEVISYTEKFYEGITLGSLKSAEEVVPIILELLRPKSVIEIGCGLGTWLSVFSKNGVDDILGVDGEWVDKNKLLIPEDKFMHHNLETPFRIERQFDLVVSLEVAEHISIDQAETFIDTLTGLGPVILFSAAIPFQGGRHHINHQWPNYWVELFENKGYRVIDYIRKKIWENDKIEWWYRQNMLLFVKQDYLEKKPLLKKVTDNTSLCQLSVVHPKAYLNKVNAILILQDPNNFTVGEIFKFLPIVIRNSLVFRFKGLFNIYK